MTAHTAPGPRLLPLSISDLLLILILGLGSSRVLLPILAGALNLHELQGQSRMGAILLLLGLQTLLLLGVIYLVAVRLRGIQWREMGFVRLPEGWAARAVLIALLSFPLVGLISWIQQVITQRPFENPQLQVLAAPEFSWMAYFGTLFVAAVLAPIVEEIAFRGLLHRWLRERFGMLVSYAGSSIAFSLMHGILALIPAIAILGVILAWTYEKTQSLWAPIVVHAVYNAVVTTVLYVALAQGIEPGGS